MKLLFVFSLFFWGTTFASNKCQSIFSIDHQYTSIVQQIKSNQREGQLATPEQIDQVFNLFRVAKGKNGIRISNPISEQIKVNILHDRVNIFSKKFNALIKRKSLSLNKKKFSIINSTQFLEQIRFHLYSDELIQVQGSWYRPTFSFSVNKTKNKLVSIYIHLIPIDSMASREILVGGTLDLARYE